MNDRIRQGLRVLNKSVLLSIFLWVAATGGAVAWSFDRPPYNPPAVPGLVAGGPAGSVRLVDATVPLTWVYDTPTAYATVRNVTGLVHRAQLWWFLARIGDIAPWRDPVAASAIVSAALRPHQTLTVTIPPAKLVQPIPAGIYAFSVWVHVLDATSGTYVHSDGRSLKSTVDVVTTPASDVRRFAPGPQLMIEEAHLVRPPVGTDPGEVEVTIVNRTTSAQGAALWSFVAPPGVLQPWLDPQAHQSKVVQTVVGPGASVSLNVPAVWPSSGPGQVSVWLHRLTFNRSIHEDGIWLRQLVG
jgi:hypothetical protein